MIRKILVANRGEIAVRIIRSCRELGLKTVAVFSEADRKALHVRYADEAYFIGPSPSNESYLVMDKILDVAKKTGTDAIHPGYGFLSENATFARRVKEEGIIFIGPSPEAISAMGDKITARKKMIQAGVPVVPGTTEGISDENEVTRIARDIGLPVMIKASAGGGGKGMRLVTDESELINAVRNARSEAKSAFGDDTVYVEKYISSPHHIEFQVLADRFGNTIHLCERECSIQRRHQKIIEETPSPLMTPELREEMGKHAVSAAKSVNYEGAGTVEFIVDDNLNYYFLEMNTRLQVEHPITERVTGVDLVKAQINIANGEQLAYVQEDIVQRGHAIECRIYAEDAENNFMPSPGTVEHISEPLGLGVRTDGYVYPGYEIPIYYDPMISKLITWGNTRDEALSRMKRSLEEYYISGIKTSINFLKRVLETPDFVKGKYNTHFIQNNLPFLQLPCIQTDEFDDLAFIVAYLEYLNQTEYEGSTSQNGETQNNRWKEFGRRKGVIRL